MLNNNKRAQVGESITWVVATIILIVVLIIFVYVASALAKVKEIKLTNSEDLENSVDWIDSKNQIAYSINSNNKMWIEEWIALQEVERNE